MLNPVALSDFFALARERYQIRLRRAAGQPPPWTADPLLAQYHCCNVFRDDDATSRDIMQRVLPANPGGEWAVAIIARLVNREDSLQRLFPAGRLAPTYRAILDDLNVNTHAYKINTPAGLNSRTGILALVEQALAIGAWPQACQRLADATAALQRVVTPFIAYQAAHDLKGSALPAHPDDEDTWTQYGPGAVRGALLVCGHDFRQWIVDGGLTDRKAPIDGTRLETLPDKYQARAVQALAGAANRIAWTHEVAVTVLAHHALRAVWPPAWPAWHLGEVEHMLCEYDKIARWRTIGPAGARVFRGAAEATEPTLF